MASGQTQYYGLSQWEAADKVERVDFNSDNAKIDGALHRLESTRNCLIWTDSYIGDGGDTKALTFPHRPFFVPIMGRSIQTLMMSHAAYMHPRISSGLRSPMAAAWDGRSVTFGPSTSNQAYGCNIKDEVYAVLALIDPDN